MAGYGVDGSTRHRFRGNVASGAERSCLISRVWMHKHLLAKKNMVQFPKSQLHPENSSDIMHSAGWSVGVQSATLPRIESTFALFVFVLNAQWITVSSSWAGTTMTVQSICLLSGAICTHVCLLIASTWSHKKPDGSNDVSFQVNYHAGCVMLCGHSAAVIAYMWTPSCEIIPLFMRLLYLDTSIEGTIRPMFNISWENNRKSDYQISFMTLVIQSDRCEIKRNTCFVTMRKQVQNVH